MSSNCSRYVCVLLLALATSDRCAAQYTSLIVFGDSLSDTGNDHANSFGFAVADPYYEGRLTNGPNYVDYLSTHLGLAPPLYSEAGGMNHAHGGALVFEDPLLTSWVIDSLETQKQKYLTATGGLADPDALYVVFGGGNDVRDPSIDMVTTANQLVDIVTDLAAAGASTILVPNVPDLGKTPEVTQYGQGAGAASTSRTLLFNSTVASGLDALPHATNVIQFDLFELFNEVIADGTSGGSTYGFTNVTDDCWEGGPTGIFSGFGLGDGLFPYPQCGNPEEYLFWDILHPTSAAHELLALKIFEQLTAADGDFDGNGSLDDADIDALVSQIAAGTHAISFDLTGDGFVDLSDRDAWLAEAGSANLPSGNAYLVGDATLDGVVDGADFARWNGAKFTATAAWSSGDFNADGVVDGHDFLLWNSYKFQDARDLATVPETRSSMALLVGWVMTGCCRSSRVTRTRKAKSNATLPSPV